MKKYLFLLLFLPLSFACERVDNQTTQDPNSLETTGGTDQTTPDMPLSKVEFVEMTHNFGEIKAGEKVAHTFKFKNVGDNPLKVTFVKPSCGCTATNYTQEPVPPGGEGFINIEFNSEGKSGTQNKTITVNMNTEPPVHTLSFSGEIVE